MYNNLSKLRSQDETSRAGIAWSKEEDEQLLDEMKRGVSMEDMSLSHKRTLGGIKVRVFMHCVNVQETEGLSIDSVCELYGLCVDEYSRYVNRKPVVKSKDVCKDSRDTSESMLKAILDRLVIMEKKVDEVWKMGVSAPQRR